MSKEFPTLSKAQLYTCYVCQRKLTVGQVRWYKRKPLCAKCKVREEDNAER